MRGEQWANNSMPPTLESVPAKISKKLPAQASQNAYKNADEGCPKPPIVMRLRWRNPPTIQCTHTHTHKGKKEEEEKNVNRATLSSLLSLQLVHVITHPKLQRSMWSHCRSNGGAKYNGHAEARNKMSIKLKNVNQATHRNKNINQATHSRLLNMHPSGVVKSHIPEKSSNYAKLPIQRTHREGGVRKKK